jgi:hypothetical protein
MRRRSHPLTQHALQPRSMRVGRGCSVCARRVLSHYHHVQATLNVQVSYKRITSVLIQAPTLHLPAASARLHRPKGRTY